MVVFGSLKNEQIGKVIFSGSLEECKNFCKKIVPSDYESLSIDQDNGVIEKRIISQGVPAENFMDLVS